MSSDTFSPSTRDIRLDIARGLSIFFMTFSHVVGTMGAGTSSMVATLKVASDTVAFTSFLFIFSIFLFRSLLDKPYTKSHFARTIKRIGILYGAYAIVSAVTMYQAYGFQIDWWIVFTALSFIQMPNVTEFFFPFIFYTLCFWVFKVYMRKPISVYPQNMLMRWFVGIGISTYMLGILAYYVVIRMGIEHVDVQRVIALFIGYGTIFRFPVLLYAPVVSVGFLFAFLYGRASPHAQVRLLYSFLLGVTVFLDICLLMALVFPLSLYTQFERWPPTPLFLAASLVGTMSILIISNAVQHTTVGKWFAHIGQQALFQLVFHLCLLRTLMMVGVPRSDNIFYLLGLTLCCIVAGRSAKSFAHRGEKYRFV